MESDVLSWFPHSFPKSILKKFENQQVKEMTFEAPTWISRGEKNATETALLCSHLQKLNEGNNI